MLRSCFWLVLIASTQWALGQMPPAAVGVTQARELDMAREIHLSGTVQPRHRSSVSARVSAGVIQVLVEEGDRVEAGQVLIRMDDTPFKLAQEVTRAQLVETRARLKLAQAELKRAKELHQTQVISIQDLDRAVSELAALKGTEASLKAQDAQHDFALTHTQIKAPFNGVVVIRQTEVGQWVDPGVVVLELASVADPDIWLDIPERYFGEVTTGGPAAIGFESLPDTRLKGNIRAVIPMAGDTRTFRAKIAFPNPDGRVPMGILAKVDLKVGDFHRTLAVPKDAVLDRGGMQVVFLVDAQQKAKQVSITSGLSNGDWVEVSGELQPGAKVITLGNERIFEGQALNPSERSYNLP